MYAEVRVLDGERIDRLVPGRPVALQVVTDPDPFAITKISQALALANHLPTSLACMLNPEGLLHTTAVLEEVSHTEHGDDERIAVDQVRRGFRVMYDVVNEVAAAK